MAYRKVFIHFPERPGQESLLQIGVLDITPQGEIWIELDAVPTGKCKLFVPAPAAPVQPQPQFAPQPVAQAIPAHLAPEHYPAPAQMAGPPMPIVGYPQAPTHATATVAVPSPQALPQPQAPQGPPPPQAMQGNNVPCNCRCEACRVRKDHANCTNLTPCPGHPEHGKFPQYEGLAP